MSLRVNFTYECEFCDGTAVASVMDLSQDEEGPIEIDFAFQCSQLELECDTCGKKYYTGDIEVLNEDEV